MTSPPPNGPEPTPYDGELARELSADELAVHAVLDGEATATQRDMVADRPDLLDDLEGLRAVRARLAAPLPGPDPSTVDTQVARALDAMADPGLPAEGLEPERRPGSTHRRHRRRVGPGRGHRTTSWLVAAAAVLVVALGTLTVSNLVGETSDDTASVASDAASGTDAQTSGGAEESAAPTTTGPSAASALDRSADPVVRELGAVGTLDELLATARETLDADEYRSFATDGAAESGPESPTALAPSPCDADVAPPAGVVVLVARAVLDGRDVVAVVTADEGGGVDTIRVLTADDCALVFVGPV